MPVKVAREDVLMFLRSTRVIELVTPPDTHPDVALAIARDGCYSVAAAPNPYRGRVLVGGAPSVGEGGFSNQGVVDKELSEEEVEAAAAVFRAARAKGRTVHVVDVGRESALREYISEHLHRLKSFPVLMRPDGRRLEGCANCTPEKLDRFLTD